MVKVRPSEGNISVSQKLKQVETVNEGRRCYTPKTTDKISTPSTLKINRSLDSHQQLKR